jgi:hypothetical protein
LHSGEQNRERSVSDVPNRNVSGSGAERKTRQETDSETERKTAAYVETVKNKTLRIC